VSLIANIHGLSTSTQFETKEYSKMKAALFLLLSSILRLAIASINLPVNDINIVVVTDVHSWIAGRKRHEPQWDADYGHVLSFYEQLQSQWGDQNLLFIMNGDFTDGTGLSASPPTQLTKILQKMPWDALNIGNHELYRNSTIQHITDGGFADYWGDKYITSNVKRSLTAEDHDQQHQTLGGSQYLIWNGPSANVLLFGFLYDMTGNDGLVIVEPVEHVITQDWFKDVLSGSSGSYDAIVCMVHMDFQDALITVLLKKIRSVVGDEVPIQFISGHTHIRAYNEVDERSTSFEAGHYLDTVGFVSFDKQGSNFQHVFIEANVKELQSVVGIDGDMMTENGQEVQNMILAAQEEMGLLQKLGCSPDHYFVDYAMSHPKSLWKLYMDEVINGYYFDGSPTFVFCQGYGGFRYDLFAGKINLNDLLAVNPYNDTIWRVTNELSGRDLLKVFGGPQYMCSTTDIDPDKIYEFYTVDFDLPYFVERVQYVTATQISPVAETMATTKLWVEFVSNVWQKEEYCQTSASSATYPFLLIAVAFVVAAVLLLVVGVVAARRRAAVQVYDRATETSVATSASEGLDENELI
jgi:2',3'-cyclic-nucleotide 2'-phosphodiesterase (5'-nucleotidase family)